MRNTRRAKHRNLVSSIATLAVLSALYYYSLTEDVAGSDLLPVGESARRTTRQLELVEETPNDETSDQGSFAVCGRATGEDLMSSPSLYKKYAGSCPSEFDPDSPTLVLEGDEPYGRTGNQLREFLRAVQYTRDNGLQLAVVYHSWATKMLSQHFLAREEGEDDKDWMARLERVLCVKVLRSVLDLQGARIILEGCEDLFNYRSRSHPEEYVESQLFSIQNLFRHVNNGEGMHDNRGREVRDMCSGIDSLFGGRDSILGQEGQGVDSAVYSVIHLRHLERAGTKILKNVSKRTGCDRKAGLEMRPDYVKSILAPLDMLRHPIVVITDGQAKHVVERLKADPEIGPMINLVPEEAAWVGGDITLAIMATAFVGNPASTFSVFISQARKALGLANSFMYRAKDERGEWATVCGDECLFVSGYTNVYSESSFHREAQRVYNGSTLCSGTCVAALRRGRRHAKAKKLFWQTNTWQNKEVRQARKVLQARTDNMDKKGKMRQKRVQHRQRIIAE